MYDPEYLQHKVDYANKLDDPFSPPGIWQRELGRKTTSTV